MSEQQRWAVMCSMTGYWGVARPEHSYREEDGLLACIEWESLHDTWAEAMQEADRMAHTITVTLPANPDRVLPVTTVDAYDRGYGVWIERTYRVAWDWEITIPDAYRETVALALLTHARKETN